MHSKFIKDLRENDNLITFRPERQIAKARTAPKAMQIGTQHVANCKYTDTAVLFAERQFDVSTAKVTADAQE